MSEPNARTSVEIEFMHRPPHPCIIRFVEMQVAEKMAAVHPVGVAYRRLDSRPDSLEDVPAHSSARGTVYWKRTTSGPHEAR